MSTFTVQNVVNGQLPATLTPIFTAGVTTYIKRFDLFNTDGSADDIQIWIQPSSGTAYQWRGLTLQTLESADLLEEGESITLGFGDQIQAQASTAAVVNYTITQVTET